MIGNILISVLANSNVEWDSVKERDKKWKGNKNNKFDCLKKLIHSHSNITEFVRNHELRREILCIYLLDSLERIARVNLANLSPNILSWFMKCFGK